MSEEDNNHRVECFRKLAADMNLGHSAMSFGVAYVVAFSGGPNAGLLGVMLGFYASVCFLCAMRMRWDARQDRKDNLLIEDLDQ